MMRFRGLLALLAIATTLVFLIGEADARAGRGGSFGSRGGATFKPPPATTTAPNQAQPMQRSLTQPGQTNPTVGRNAAPGAATTGLAGRGGFMGGLLGAGLIGMLLGYGLAGGLGSLAAIFGLLLQIGLILAVAALIWSWWQRRQAQQNPAYAGMPRQMHEPSGPRGALGGGALSSGGAVAGATTPGLDGNVAIGPDDYDDFERLLSEIQAAYSSEDLAALRQRATPEMVSYFAEDLADNASRGVANRVSGVKLLQGDLAEAWREGNSEYATVAMRFELVDKTVERGSDRVVEGSDKPVEVTELWTFRRAVNGDWLLSAIQQA